MTHAPPPTAPPLPAMVARCARCDARGASVCAEIADDDLVHLARATTQIIRMPGQLLVEEGAPAHDFFTITSGNAKLFKLLSDGRRQIMSFAGPGDFIGLAASDVHAASVEAIDTITACRIPRTRMHALMTRFPELEHRLLREAGRELSRAQSQILLLGRKTARERVASFLLSHVPPSGHAMCAAERFAALPMTRADIADYLGLTIETVSRTLSQLGRDQVIALDAQHAVRVLDFERLQTIATPGS
ncbi:Crp/Fnr family transcriptional regulator [Tanticharoenia sakaeratensis]|uniref:Crp/Fnr family transcriptional regulator n=1 Tax=Tanticharoenia sakaeratensis TaxID=444053 RepID=UPI001F526227|nr:helix-turn-helix domain-containing protein [Tanticharoenia sakaeratensis]